MTAPARHATDEPLGAVVHRLAEQLPQLVRSEVRLAQAELAEKGKRAGIGLGAFGVAGALAWFGVGTLVTAAVLGLATVLPGWASALVVAGVLLLGAAVAGLLGKKEVQQATPPAPEHALASVKDDVATLKGGHR